MKGLFRPPVRAELDDQDRQRNMRREKYQGKSRQDRGPPLQATQRGLKYENATRGLFYALSGATREKIDLERIDFLINGSLESELLKRTTLTRWNDEIVANCVSGLFGQSATDLCKFLGFESNCPHLDYATFASTLADSFTSVGMDDDTQLLLLNDAAAHFVRHRSAFEATFR